MAARPRKSKAKPKPRKCLLCSRAVRARGLCRLHYHQADYEVRAGRASWPKLVELGLALPVGGQSRNPFRVPQTNKEDTSCRS